MKDVFVYGTAVEGDNFTDREAETRRLKANFENGINTLLISPRRIGKTSLVRKVKSLVNGKKIAVVYLDMFDCRSEYDFYNKLASAVLKQTATRKESVLQNIKNFLGRISPKISFSPDPTVDFSFSLGITAKDYSPEELLNLAETIAQKQERHIVICIDEFQQVGEFPDSVTVQKRMRGVWQLQKNVSYCLFGSKKHLMTNIFQSKSMPFYQFGDAVYLGTIPTEKWVPFICKKFSEKNVSISKEQAERICNEVDCYSSYVQQLAWLTLLNSEKKVSDESIQKSVDDLVDQNSALFIQQTDSLSTFQMNMLRAIANGVHDNFTSKEIMEQFPLGTKSNIVRLKKVLIDKELIELRADGLYMADPVFMKWFKKL